MRMFFIAFQLSMMKPILLHWILFYTDSGTKNNLPAFGKGIVYDPWVCLSL